MSTIIVRIWHGRTKAIHAEEYLSFLKKRGISDYSKTKGNLSIEIWRQQEKEVCHFWTVTTWDSVESIKEFAGEDYEKAKYFAEDYKYLLEFESRVKLCEYYKYK